MNSWRKSRSQPERRRWRRVWREGRGSHSFGERTECATPALTSDKCPLTSCNAFRITVSEIERAALAAQTNHRRRWSSRLITLILTANWQLKLSRRKSWMKGGGYRSSYYYRDEGGTLLFATRTSPLCSRYACLLRTLSNDKINDLSAVFALGDYFTAQQDFHFLYLFSRGIEASSQAVTPRTRV